jgi:hypothetical protein
MCGSVAAGDSGRRDCIEGIAAARSASLAARAEGSTPPRSRRVSADRATLDVAARGRGQCANPPPETPADA